MSQASPFDNILAQCRDLFTERLVGAVSAMIDKADDTLLEMMQATRDPNLDALYRETRDKVLAERENLATQFRTRYLREFQQRSNHAKKIGGSLDDIDLDSIELALVGEDDLNETLKVNAMAGRLRQYCEEELVALDQRVGVLFGDAGLHPDDNPFAPQAVCDAYKQACSQVDSNVAVRMILLKLFDDHVLDEIRSVYKAVNALLVQNSILPKIRGAARKDREKTATPAEPEGAAEAGAENDFFSMLQNLVKKPPAAAGTAPLAGPIGAPLGGAPAAYGPGGGVVPQILEGPDLMHSLTRLQVGDLSAVSGNTTQLAVVVNEPGTTNVLRELKASSVGSSMSEMDSITLDIVALLFDQLFDDPQVPIAIKGLIGRLQIPFLKVAISDKALFSKKHHPARLMLDTLGECAARMPMYIDDTHPVFARLSVILNKLVEDYEDDIGVFDDVRQRLQELLREEDEQLEQEARAAEEQIRQEESLALAKTIAQTEIKMRLRGAALPPAVTDFLSKEWIKVLILTQIKHSEQSEEWKNALETMDLLIWSIEPKGTLDERRELVGKVPVVLKRVTEALSLASVEDAVRVRLLGELRKLHSEILTSAKAPAAATTETLAPPVAAPTEPATEPTPPAAGVPAEAEEVAPEPAAAFELPALDFAPSAPGEAEPKVEARAEPAAAPVTPPASEEPAPELPQKFELPDLDFATPEPATQAPSPAEAEPSPASETPAPKTSEKAEAPSLELTPTESARPAPEPVVKPAAPAAPPTPAPEQPEQPKPAAPAAKPFADFELPPVEPKPAAPAKPAAQAQPAAKPAAPHKPGPPAAPAQRPASPSAAAPRAPAASPAPAKPAAQPGQPVSRPASPKPATPPMDFSAPVKVANPFGEGEVEVNDLDFTMVLRSPSGAKPAPALPPEIVPGAWVSIKLRGEQEEIRFAKLNYVSPLKTRFLFVDRLGKTALDCTQAELVKFLEIGEVTITTEPPAEQPLFDRIAEGAIGKLGGKK